MFALQSLSFRWRARAFRPHDRASALHHLPLGRSWDPHKTGVQEYPRTASVGFPSYRITMLLQGVTPAGPRQYRTVTPLPRSSTAAGHHEIRAQSFRTPIVKRKVVRQAQAFAFGRRTQSNVRPKQRDRSPRGLQARLRGGSLILSQCGDRSRRYFEPRRVVTIVWRAISAVNHIAEL